MLIQHTRFLAHWRRPSWFFLGIALCWAMTHGGLLAKENSSESKPERANTSVRHAAKLGLADWSTELNQVLEAELPPKRPAAAEPGLADALLLRRLYLDLVGSIPRPDEVESFLQDPSPGKVERVVDQLLADERFGKHWGNYWRDVIYYRRSDPRALVAAPATSAFVAEALNQNRPWTTIAKEFITAEGDVREIGKTAILAAQQGQAAETAAEVSRVFMGVQIQCAQCHDHPTEDWKREQFHELAAFFTRVSFHRNKDADARTFVVEGNDRPRRMQKKDGAGSAGSLEYMMPDLNDPAAEGTRIQPKFFVDGKTLPIGTTDQVRREQLADWLTAETNPYFAHAFVNRVWSELIGWGFYSGVDELGPGKTPVAPHTLELLTSNFVTSGYTPKSLIRAIALSDAYRQPERWQHVPKEFPAAGANTTLLSSDQLFESLAVVMQPAPGEKEDAQTPAAGRKRQRPAGKLGKMMLVGGVPLKYAQTFGYDPSLHAEEIAASVPQALSMMNDPQLQKRVSASARFTWLGRMVTQQPGDESLVRALYLKILCRPPTAAEAKVATHYLATGERRNAAAEDLAWVLLNGAEFRNRP